MITRKIIHIDMDAFYASVELREQPHLRGKPVVVAWDGARSVICAASYEARKFGLHSAMAVSAAKRLCPQAIFIPPQFALYREVSQQIHAIFRQHTDLIEPLSLDEAYLDVTVNKQNMEFAQDIATQIRAEILRQTSLTASAGIAPNKFLAKIASDWRKPNGQFVLPPQKVAAFLRDLPLGKISGVGKKDVGETTRARLAHGWRFTKVPMQQLVSLFGKWGYRLHDLAHGIDNHPVQAERERVQISTEITLPEDLPLNQIVRHVPDLARDLAQQIRQKSVEGQTVTLKLKTADFHTLTRSQTYSSAMSDESALILAAQQLAARMPSEREYRLIGLGISHLQPEDLQLGLEL
ncbi:DNA polymerase IV [Kingella negevensis]|uniref:DNA polymerase IV n=1 Tax=Kingella negevensis TaxID=1522312 RepID=UPI0025436B1D|nr:DNA polymerase IV [Kingella negevensis]WII92342.1 DNA polymerase IV [Kingella negevensis]